ncbi:MAG: PHP domain-containing protein [Cytophagales bacterium]|nr:PHP domain-containing protein [Cytophagales bacterium]
MENEEIVNLLELTAKLMELHDENPFKIKSYSSAAFNLDKVSDSLVEMDLASLEKLEGVGKGIASKIDQIIHLNTFPELEELMAKTPKGVLEMLGIKGIGPKKVRSLWKELGIETKDALLKACENNQVAALKGFGEKTQEMIKGSLLFAAAQSNKWFYSEAESISQRLLGELETVFGRDNIELTGEMARRLETIELVEFVIMATPSPSQMEKVSQLAGFQYDIKISGPWTWRGVDSFSGIKIQVNFADKKDFPSQVFIHSSSDKHLSYTNEGGMTLLQYSKRNPGKSAKDVYEDFKLPNFIPELREGLFEFNLSQEVLSNLVTYKDLKGILHNHSTYSDGKHTLEQMARYCKELGFEYLGISDHSKSAFYAKGLYEDKILKQHQEIDELNKVLAPFKIFKGIESDILMDGSLDYGNDILASFDFIVASVHSVLKMDIDKATKRLIKAIENPYTTILGHPTGRLLLKREGYPIDHQKVIDACSANGVIIEINANPWRLDLDWRWVHYATERGVLISINPDAHEMQGYLDMVYGIYVARKGALTKDMTFNALNKDEVEKYFQERNGKRKDR